MSIFDFFTGSDINEGVKQFREHKNAVLLDVRSKEEYAAGHIPGSINIPLFWLFQRWDMKPPEVSAELMAIPDRP